MKGEELMDETVTIKICNICEKELNRDEDCKIEYQGRCRICDLKQWEEELFSAIISGNSLEERKFEKVECSTKEIQKKRAVIRKVNTSNVHNTSIPMNP